MIQGCYKAFLSLFSSSKNKSVITFEIYTIRLSPGRTELIRSICRSSRKSSPCSTIFLHTPIMCCCGDCECHRTAAGAIACDTAKIFSVLIFLYFSNLFLPFSLLCVLFFSGFLQFSLSLYPFPDLGREVMDLALLSQGLR